VTSPNGGAFYWAGSSGDIPATAIERALRNCEEQAKARCTVHTVNNVAIEGRDWKAAAPPPLPPIGRLRPQPWWLNRGPQQAAGLIVWSHGYMSGVDSTHNAPQGEVADFTIGGYDLYRFDREYIRDWAADAGTFVDAIRQARAMGYRRIVLAGQSAGAWVSLAATARGAAVDGVISIAAAHHGVVSKMTDVTRARSDWQKMVRAIRPGPRILLVNFARDEYDVGGRMDDARAAFAAAGVDAVIIADPPGFTGHGAGTSNAFPRKYGTCIHDFIERGRREAPCT
jgi:pimeloyl-ACP methyl ester carboxylesterase